MRIGDFARLGQVSVRMLRHYESLGLLIPEGVDRFTGHRRYSVAQLPRLNAIMALNSLGIQLSRIAELLASEPSSAELAEMLILRRHQLLAEQEATASKLSEVEFRLALIERTTMTHPDCIIKDLPAERILGRTVLLGEPPFDTAEIGPLFGSVPTAIAHAGGDPLTGVGIYTETSAGTEVTCGYRSENTTSAAEIAAASAGEGVAVTELPATTAATLIHVGSMDGVGASWQHLGKWCLSQGYELSGPCREVYLEAGDGTDDSDQSGWVVELQQPVTR